MAERSLSWHYYDDIASTVPAHLREKPGLQPVLMQQFARARLILDVGCGVGIDAARLQMIDGAVVVGFDRAVSCVCAARARGVKAVAADWDTHWPWQAACFDGALLAYVIHYVRDRPRFVDELRRCLRPEAAAVVLTTSPCQIERRALNRYFPGLRGVDIARYPDPVVVAAEFAARGFASTSIAEVVVREERVDVEYLELVRERRWSSLALLDDGEFREGLHQLERDAALARARGHVLSWPNRKTMIVAV